MVTAANTGTNPDLRVEAATLRAVSKLHLPKNGATGKGDWFQVGEATFRQSDLSRLGTKVRMDVTCVTALAA